MQNIIPRSIPPHHARVTPVEMAIRTIVEFDVRRMRDRLRSDLFINGHQAGVYAVVMVDEDVPTHDIPMVLERDAEMLERTVIEEFVGHQYRQRVDLLEKQVQTLHETNQELRQHVHRVRWWQVRRHWAAWRSDRG